jgi:site-specific DNA-cytosine methylase
VGESLLRLSLFLGIEGRIMKPVALGANIFAGGFSLGVSRHFKLLGHLEHDDYGAAVSSKNLKVPVFIGTDGWPGKLNELKLNGRPVRKLDFLYSNPPCAIWSVASGRGGENWRNDPRLQRIRDIFKLVDRFHPDVWCWESVCQAFSRGREFVEELADEAKKRGYSTTYLLIDAAYLGTPQHRKRFFLVLHKVAIDWKTPAFGQVKTAGEALRGIKPNMELITKLSNHVEGKVLRHAKPGELLSRVYDRIFKKPKIGSRGQKLGRPSFLKRRLDPKLPATTVIGNAMFHPTANRFLAVNETAALCGYPQSWQWPKSDGYNLIARGVMPPVGEWLARHVAAAVKRGRKSKGERWLVDFRQAPGRIVDLHGGELPDNIDLDWKPVNVSAHQQKLVGTNGKPSSRGRIRAGNQGGKPARKLQAASSGAGAARRSLPLASLAEATRRGIPDREEQGRIRVALRELKKGKTPSTSGMLIRARLIEAKKSEHEIVAEVLKKFEGRKTTIADVSYHKGKLRRAGMIV